MHDDPLSDALLGMDGDDIRLLAESALDTLGRDQTAPLFWRLYNRAMNTGTPTRFGDAYEAGRDREERAALLASIGWLPEGISLDGPFIRAIEATPARQATIPTIRVLAGFMLFVIVETARLGKAPALPHVRIVVHETQPVTFVPFYRHHRLQLQH
jgi:hypothetical protein